ncbi:hypothetical protein [Nannocystis pusilla]|uniref:hypothetical protein n=1 Tax=Nannocystis pusilla TaxID=889268 RepID=UPI003DA4D671
MLIGLKKNPERGACTCTKSKPAASTAVCRPARACSRMCSAISSTLLHCLCLARVQRSYSRATSSRQFVLRPASPHFETGVQRQSVQQHGPAGQHRRVELGRGQIDRPAAADEDPPQRVLQ